MFSQIQKTNPNASFYIFGSDDSELAQISKTIKACRAVRIFGPVSINQIIELSASYDYYLQLSDFEGMAMSVVEAMQSGLIPIVTPVGEILNYIEDGSNGFIVELNTQHQWFQVVQKINS